MEYYNDKRNKAGLKVLFLFAQAIVLLVVYMIVYTSFVAVHYAIEKYELSWFMYLPVIVALVIFPIVLYKYRQMYNDGKMLAAVTWMMGTASFTVVLLYVYVVQIAG
ncbi:MAG: hypothetical protein U9O64_04110 [Campylobacterota bacterium]|nr:hypothetical protein [Campylobacterota bacterium]